MTILDDTRADWNARNPLRPLTPVPWAERVGVSWHWIGPGRGPSAGGPHQKCLDQVRDWQAQHQDPNGRIKGKDIGYNALICQHARAIEGRGLAYSGAHSPGVNWAHVGVQFMVGQDGDPPTDAMLARAARLRADIGALGKNIRRDWGHRDDPEASTTCPGNWLAAWVNRGGPTITPTVPEEDDMQLTDKVTVAAYPAAPGATVEMTLEAVLARASWAYHETVGLRSAVADVQAKLATLAAGDGTTGLDPARAEAIYREELAKRLAEFTFVEGEVQS